MRRFGPGRRARSLSIDPLTAFRRALADRYALGEKLGEGGAADVYRADDVRHGRDVAIKILRPEIAETVGSARFLSEIRVTANLRHPNILPLYDSGEAAGLLYYVMPRVVEGSLADLLARENRLPIDEALRLARQVAAALDHAHGRGVIHRDVKPSNILLEEGQAIVSDFGIARALRGDGRSVRGPRLDVDDSELRTRAGAAIGSPTYMSPEQALGSADVDARSDQYALACVVYEMLAGRPPFDAPSSLAVLAAHALDPVPPLEATRPGVPPRIAVALERALSKRPADRFASLTAFLEALPSTEDGAWAAAPRRAWAPGDRTGVAVLPFASLPDATCAPSGGGTCDAPGEDYFVDGMHDAVIAELSRIAALAVVSRTTMLRYRAAPEALPTVAAQLGADAVLEGSVLHAEGRVRITLRLVDPHERQLWAETYDRDVTDVLALHAEIAAAVAEAVHATLTAEERRRLEARRPVDPAVYELYLRGRHQSAFVPVEAYRAIRYFEQAIERDGAFAPAHAGLARRYAWLASLGLEPGVDVLPKAAEAAARALELEPGSADALAVFGYLRFVQHWDVAGARAALERACELEPGNLDALVDYAFLLCATADFGRARRIVDRIAELDPFSPPTALFEGWTYVMARRYDDAIAVLDRGAARHPGFAYLPVFSAFSEWMRGNRERAIELARFAESLDPDSKTLDFLNVLGWVYAKTGCEADARRVLAHAESQLEGDRGAWFRWMTLHALGDRDEAYRWCDLAFEQRNPMLVLLAVHPMSEDARQDPVIGPRIRSMGFGLEGSDPELARPA